MALGSTSRWSTATPHRSKLARVRRPYSSSPTLPTKHTCGVHTVIISTCAIDCAQSCSGGDRIGAGRIGTAASPRRTLAPNLAAATAWFAPLPPHAVVNDVPCSNDRREAH